MSMFDTLLDRIGRWIAGRIEARPSGYVPYTQSDIESLTRVLQPGDILLIEGIEKVSTAIKYLTQSTWSHVAIYIGDALGSPAPGEKPKVLVDVTVARGVAAIPLEMYETYNTRICRPVGLTDEDRDAVVRFIVGKIGLKYDTRHIFDLARYLLPIPPIPVRWRRRMISLGSGEPTRAICSTLIAQAYQNVQYPILPKIDRMGCDAASGYTNREILTIRHHSLFVPRDFDLSPYFKIVKPTLENDFSYKSIEWADPEPTDAPPEDVGDAEGERETPEPADALPSINAASTSATK